MWHLPPEPVLMGPGRRMKLLAALAAVLLLWLALRPRRDWPCDCADPGSESGC